MIRITMILLALAWSTLWSVAQPGLSHKAPAWIAVPDASPDGYGVYYFRKEFQLQDIPSSFLVNVSGDNRYKLFVNGCMVSLGPARSDVQNWNYETVDLQPFLIRGKNVLAAKVWNDGKMKPEANMSHRTGFFMRGASAESKVVDTDENWWCVKDNGFLPLMPQVPGYYTGGPGELRDFHKAVTGWQATDCDMTLWTKAETINDFYPSHASGAWGTYSGWQMQPSPIPLPELTQERLVEIRKTTGIKATAAFLQGKAPLTIPSHADVELILDQSHLTNAYLSLVLSRGEGSTVSIGYAESLYDTHMNKGDRNSIEGKHFVGRKDSILCNGDEEQMFTTMEWRTFRYVVLNVKTAGEPLVLQDIYGTFTGYPFQLRASLDTKDQELHQFLDVGWRTARLCAIETYMDCPYYEQLQYFGDARIQALISLYNTDDDRLVRNCINQADMSRTPEGVTQSRYPSTLPQYIQPYALHNIYALHDYMMYGKDIDFVRQHLQGVRSTLEYFQHFLQQDGRVKGLPGWNFTDWVYGFDNWKDGVALAGKDGSNAVMDLQLLYAYQMAAEMESVCGMEGYASRWKQRAHELGETIISHYKRPALGGIFSDLADKDVFSQHTNSLAILTHLVEGEEAVALARTLEQDTSLAPASIYFRFYLHQAMTEAGLGDHYLSWLDKWRENLRLGLTTWGETSEVESTRSDCHAWGASPNIELFRTVLGIDSDAPSFRRVRIMPHLGDIKEIGGTMPHPDGTISVHYKQGKKNFDATITLPQGITGVFAWKGSVMTLHGGTNEIKL